MVVLAKTPPSKLSFETLALWPFRHTFWTFLVVVTIQNHFETKSFALGSPMSLRDAAANTLIFKYHYAGCNMENQYIKWRLKMSRCNTPNDLRISYSWSGFGAFHADRFFVKATAFLNTIDSQQKDTWRCLDLVPIILKIKVLAGSQYCHFDQEFKNTFKGTHTWQSSDQTD